MNLWPDHETSTDLLPPGRKFSWLPDGRRRACAIVRVVRSGRKGAYILEIARPDQRSLSTLIVQFAEAKNREDEEKAIQELRYQRAKRNHVT